MTKTDDRHVAERFYVENPEWTYGRKLVVLASDYDKLEALYRTQVVRNEQLEEQRAEWERAARIQRERNAGRITLVKTTPTHDARGLPINPTKLGGGPYEP